MSGVTQWLQNMQKFYWNNSGAPPPAPGPGHTYRDKVPHPHLQGPGQSYQTLTLAINSNNQPLDYTYIQQTNNRRAIRTNEAVNIKNNDNEFSSSQHAPRAQSDTQNSIRVQNSEIKNAAKTIHLNSSNDYYIKVNGNKQCIQVNQSYLKDAACNKNFQGSCNRVVLKLGDISGPGPGASSELNQRSHNPTQSRWRVNKTWNENMKGKYRQSIQTADIFKHDYENVFENTKPSSDVKTETKKDNSRQTPRSRKKSKHPGSVYRSKSCERVACVIDRLSEKLSISGPEAGPGYCGDSPPPAPPTPTPSLLHSKLARAIPCVDIKVVIIETRYSSSVLQIFCVLFISYILFSAWVCVIWRSDLAHRESRVRGSWGGSLCILPLSSSKSFVLLSARTLFIQLGQTAKLMNFEFRTTTSFSKSLHTQEEIKGYRECIKSCCYYPGTIPTIPESGGPDEREAGVCQQEDEDHPVPICWAAPRRHPEWRPPWDSVWPRAGGEAGEAVSGDSARAPGAGPRARGSSGGPGPGPRVLRPQPLRQGRAWLPGRVTQSDQRYTRCC